MDSPIADIAGRLADDAEAVCRHYLSRGHREGRYWVVGDVHNRRGRSLYVRLETGSNGPAGKWTDAATGEHGDLVDLIRLATDAPNLASALTEARCYLGVPAPQSSPRRADPRCPVADTREIARRLWCRGLPIADTRAEAYLGARGLVLPPGDTLRYLPHCHYRPSGHDRPGTAQAWPAMTAAVRDNAGQFTGLHRTWLDHSRPAKAPVASPRRALGMLRGQGIRFGDSTSAWVAGEGIETILSVHRACPWLAAVATLSAAHLAALLLPSTLRRLYIAEDCDPAGRLAADRLAASAHAQNISVTRLRPRHGDWNSVLQARGIAELHATLVPQLHPQDIA